MIAALRPARLCLPVLFILLALASTPSVAVGGPPRPEAGPSLRFTGADIPAPPMQKKPWTAPKAALPAKLVAAITLLFEQGFADPRGCEYREIRVAAGGYLGRTAEVLLTHGWVLPGRPDDAHRFAVCWNGLVYPVATVGARADLKADVGAAIKRAKRDESSEEFDPPDGEEGQSLWHRRLKGGRCIALVLRAGEGELAEQLWKAEHPSPAGLLFPVPVEDEGDTYRFLAAGWAWHVFIRGVSAHMRGDDRLALHDFRRLNALAPLIEAEARRHGDSPKKEREEGRFLGFLAQLPDLLADQTRRAGRAPRPPVVCLGPDREPNSARRIASLIDRLDEVSGPQFGRIDLATAPLVAALVREGEQAVEPLLRCYEADTRLTRSVSVTVTGYSRPRSVLAVHEAALAALRGLLEGTDFEPRVTDDMERDAAKYRKEVARQVREHLKTHSKKLPLADRLFRDLANDAVRPPHWAEAVWMLVEPEDAGPAHGKSGGRPQLKGEPLRGKKDPSVTELIVKRIGQTDNPAWAAALALALRRWDEKAALPLMADLTTRCRDAAAWSSYHELIAARLEAGDRKGLDDYVKWVRTLKPETLEGGGESWVFRPMWLNPKHPGMAEAAERLFADKGSPWLPLFRHEGTEDRLVCGSTELPASPLLALPAFRKAVLAELGNKGGRGAVVVRRDGAWSYLLEGIESVTCPSPIDPGNPEIPKQGAKGTFRICDFVAYHIAGKIDGAPRCELYWPEKQRDAAVAACAEFLKRYGDHLGPDGTINLPRLDRPATREQADNGKAIFSLEGEGKARTVKLPAFPTAALWVTHKEAPYEERSTDPLTRKVTTTVAYDQDGKVYQAEEVFTEGQWRRYYGFVGSHRVARVPASEVEFPPPEEKRRSAAWVRLADGLDGRLRVTRPEGDVGEEWVPRWPAGAAPSCALELWNRQGTDRPFADLKGVRPRLYYSPETVSRQGELVPRAVREADWEELKPRPAAALKVEAGRSLPPAEKRTACTFAVRDWFDAARPGFYRLVLPPANKGESPPQEVRFSVAPR
jgi:hypothetical protein